MTSHKEMFKGHSEDELGALIRWALHEGIGEAHPPPEVWARVRTRVEQPTVWRRLGAHRAYRAAMVYLSKTGAFLSAQITSRMQPQDVRIDRWTEVRLDPRLACFLFDQPGFLWLRLAL